MLPALFSILLRLASALRCARAASRATAFIRLEKLRAILLYLSLWWRLLFALPNDTALSLPSGHRQSAPQREQQSPDYLREHNTVPVEVKERTGNTKTCKQYKPNMPCGQYARQEHTTKRKIGAGGVRGRPATWQPPDTYPQAHRQRLKCDLLLAIVLPDVKPKGKA